MYQILRSAAYRIPGRFASLDEFTDLVIRELEQERIPETDTEGICAQLEKLGAKFPVISQDIILLKRELQDHGVELATPFLERVRVVQRQIERALVSLDFQVAPAKVYVVDTMPSPFDATAFDALTVDRFDEIDFGIPEGIYFRRDLLVPDLALHTYAHELVHTLISHYTSDRYLARGFEEGVCEIFGALYLDAAARGEELAFTTHRNSMLTYNQDVLWDHYLHYSRQAYLFFRERGLDGLSSIIRGGRSAMKSIEMAFLNGHFDSLKQPQGSTSVHSDFERHLQALFLGLDKNLVVDLKTFQILPFIKPGASISELADSTGLHSDLVRNMLQKFQEQHFLILLDGDAIRYSDLDPYFSKGLIRYSC